jgi:TolC family type I secretion outer membrane protein
VRYKCGAALACLLILFGCAALAQTPPIQPKLQETPLPPPVELSAPANVPAEVANRPLTADEAAAIALRRQPTVAAAIAALTAAKGRKNQATAGLLPSVSTGASYNNTAISPTTATTGPVGTATTPGYQVTANLRQLLFDFNHTRDVVRQATALARSASSNLTQVESDLALQTKQAFYTLVQNQGLVGVNEADVRNQQSHLASAKARLEDGVGIPADVVRAEAAVASAIFGLSLARNSASVSRVNLAELMGIDPRTPVVVAEGGEPPFKEEAVESLVKQALSRRPEVLQAQSNLDAAAHGLNAARRSDYPSLGANVGWLQRGSDFPPESKSLTYGFSLSWTPFDSGLTRGRVQEAQGNIQSAQAQLESVRLAVISDVSQAYLNLKTAEQRVPTADSEVANAEEALRLTEGMYQSGLGKFLDVLDAQTALTTAKTNRVNAQSAVDQARAAMAHAIGAGEQSTARGT